MKILLSAMFLLSFSVLADDPKFHVSADGQLVPSMARGAVVTGEVKYPTSAVLADLGMSGIIPQVNQNYCGVDTNSLLKLSLDAQDEFVISQLGPAEWTNFNRSVTEAGLKDHRILSEGEGYSSLVPFLRKFDAQAYGLDLWYGNTVIPDGVVDKALMETYRTTYAEHLLKGNATDLTHVEGRDFQKIADGSFDMVLSHHMFAYHSESDRKKILAEALRVTKKGGTIRFADFLTEYFNRDAVRSAQQKEQLLALMKQAKKAGGRPAIYVFNQKCEYLKGSLREDKGIVPAHSDAFNLKDLRDLLFATNGNKTLKVQSSKSEMLLFVVER